MSAKKPMDSGVKAAWIGASALILAAIISGVFGLIQLTHSQQSSTQTPTPTPTSTPTTPLSPTSSSNLLYQANWSNGLNGWKGGSQWTVSSGGILVSNGNSQDNKFMIAPYQPTTANYAVEAQIQFLRPMSSSSDPTLFGIMVRSGADGDKVGYDCYMYKNSAKIRIAADPNSKVLQEAPYTLDTSWHTYRVEASNNSITCFIDNVLVLHVTDNTYTHPGLSGLFDINSQINVRSFKVFSL